MLALRVSSFIWVISKVILRIRVAPLHAAFSLLFITSLINAIIILHDIINIRSIIVINIIQGEGRNIMILKA